MKAFSERTWFELRAAALAGRCRFNTQWTKAQAREQVYEQLADRARLRRILQTWGQTERRALQRLQAAGGSLPRHRFTRDYGTIRPCRQRPHDAPKPWIAPHSPAERLWFAGFIEITRCYPQTISLTNEAAAILPPLPAPRWCAPPVSSAMVGTRAALCLDVAVLLGMLLAGDVRPLFGCWLPPRALRRINARLSQPEALERVRGERHAGRMAFVHYVALAAGLVAVQDGLLKPTVSAWAWLDLPPEERWQTLWTALEKDRAARGWWRRFRLPELPDSAWGALVRWLNLLTPGTYESHSLIEAVRPYLAPDEAADLGLRVQQVIERVFASLGWARWQGTTVTVLPAIFPDDQPSTLQAWGDQQWIIALAPMPRLAPLVELLAWTGEDAGALVIGASAVRRCCAQGGSAMSAARSIAALCGAFPAPAFAALQAWERAARTLTLRPQWVLTAADPNLLDHLCADRGLRSLIDQPLSRHHLAVRADRIDAFTRKLERRGLKVTAPASNVSAEPSAAAYQYLAVRTIQGLSAFIAPPVPVPASVRMALAAQLTPHETAALDRLAEQTLNLLSAALQGYSETPPLTPLNPGAITAAVGQAYDECGALTIDYFSPARGAVTTRQIEPIRLYERNGVRYVEAWCGDDDDTRTFRLDRILAAQPP